MGHYNLPDAWDPGFAMPKNVQDEGLERRAFVTRQLPRGTYDDPDVGYGGYTVPQYVRDEGYGQGTFTTRQPPDGTYDGPKIPNWLNQRPKVVKTTRLPGGGQQVTVQALGDAPLPEPFESYGQQAAAILISRFAPLPPKARQAGMRKLMDTLDKSLWSRTQDIFNRYVREQKMAPADAFPLALARALSTGIAAEIIVNAKRGTAPRANSLLGLGCYGCGPVLGAMALGDDAVPAGCTPAPAGFTWIYGATVNGQWIAGHWARLPAGQKAVPFCPSGPPAGSTTVADLVASGQQIDVRTHSPTDAYDFWVGPFGFDTTKLRDRVWAHDDPSPTVANRAQPPDVMYVSPDPEDHSRPQPEPEGSPVRRMTPEILQWVHDRLVEAKDSSGNTDSPRHYTDNSAAYGFPEPDAKKWFDALGISPTTPVRLHKLMSFRTTAEPFARTTHIKTGANMVLEVSLAKANFKADYDPTKNGLALKVWLARVPDPSIFGALWNPMILINPLTALKATANVMGGALDALSDLTCEVFSSQAGQAAAGAVAAYYGVPPQAGVAGAQTAANQTCPPPPAPPPPPPPPPHKSIWPYALLAGGGILAVALLAKPRPTPKKGAP